MQRNMYTPELLNKDFKTAIILKELKETMSKDQRKV